MIDSYTEMPIPGSLINALRDGRLIPFVGAGASMSILDKYGKRVYPSWTEIFERATNRLDTESKENDAEYIRASLKRSNPNLLETARFAKEALGSHWIHFLEGQFRKDYEEIDPNSLELAKAIWELGSILVVTTNFDEVLKWACPEPRELQEWDIEAPSSQQRTVSRGADKPTVWHLHGMIENATRIILTPDGFSHLYPDESATEVKYKAALESLRQLLTQQSFLFIGYSMNDVKMVEQIRKVNDIFEGVTGPHYVLMQKDEAAAYKPNGLPVSVLQYENQGLPLIDLLKELRQEADETLTPSASTGLSAPSPMPTSPAADFSVDKYIFHVPYPQKGDQVIGREEDLKRVHEALNKGRPTAVGHAAAFKGMGGLGKTQLAVEYAYKYKNEYPNGVIWINASEDIDSQLSELATKAKWISPDSETSIKIDCARNQIQTRSNCLLIFDNVEKVDQVRDLYPVTEAQPHILITTREDIPGFNPISIDLLSREQSRTLLIQEARRKPETDGDIEATDKLLDSLQGLPLAIELAGAFLNYRASMSWTRYYELFAQNLTKAVGVGFDSFTNHDKDIFSALEVSNAALDTEPLLDPILQVLTWSGTGFMGIDLLSSLVQPGSSAELSTALALGCDLRILRQEQDLEAYSLHALIRMVRRSKYPDKTLSNWFEATATNVGNWFEARRDDWAKQPEYEAEFNHLEEWARHCAFRCSDQVARLQWLQAYPLYYRGKYKNSLEIVEDAIAKLPSSDPALCSQVLLDKATLLISIGDYQSAIIYAKQALVICEEILQVESHLTATSLHVLASSYGHNQDYNMAIVLAERSLQVGRKTTKTDHFSIGATLNNLASYYSHLGNVEKAIEQATEALRIARSNYGQEHPNVATTLNNIARYYSVLGDYPKAREYLVQSYEMRVRLLGEEHPDVASSLSSLADYCFDVGNIPEAIKLDTEALKFRSISLGDSHPDTLRSEVNILFMMYHKGRTEAIRIKARALKRRTPPDSPAYSFISDRVKWMERNPPPGFRPK